VHPTLLSCVSRLFNRLLSRSFPFPYKFSNLDIIRFAIYRIFDPIMPTFLTDNPQYGKRYSTLLREGSGTNMPFHNALYPPIDQAFFTAGTVFFSTARGIETIVRHPPFVRSWLILREADTATERALWIWTEDKSGSNTNYLLECICRYP
jgi:hypothetical protein